VHFQNRRPSGRRDELGNDTSSTLDGDRRLRRRQLDTIALPSDFGSSNFDSKQFAQPT
jgi:hypothetical protein